MTVDEFITKYNGKKIDYDNVSGCQCVDLAKYYCRDVVGITPPSGLGGAKNWWLQRKTTKILVNNFYFIDPSKKDIQKGDLGVRTTRGGGNGHIFLITAYDPKTGKMSIYDTNGGGNHDPVTKRTFYNTTYYIHGILRPKKIGSIYTPTPDSSDDTDDDTTTTQKVTVTYNKWKGHGEIKKDYTPLMWYLDDTTTPSEWGFYGMAGERIDFIGKIGNSYYYGIVHGICESKIWCVVPCSKVKNIDGKASGGTGTIVIGYKNGDNFYDGAYIGQKYSLTDQQINHLAHICVREQSHNLSAIAAEASLMANVFEYKRHFKATSYSSLYSYVLHGGWFGSSKKSNNTINNSEYAPTKAELAKVKDVLVNGNRTIPLYVNEHDWVSDIASLDGRSTGLSTSQSIKYRDSHTPSFVKNHSNYVSGKTKVHNIYGATWTFYTFFSNSSQADPFGYTADWYKVIMKNSTKTNDDDTTTKKSPSKNKKIEDDIDTIDEKIDTEKAKGKTKYIKVFLVGNSYTYKNGYGQLLSKLLYSAGYKNIVAYGTKGSVETTEVVTSDLSKRIKFRAWKNGKYVGTAEAGGNVTLKSALTRDYGLSGKKGKWDYIVIQHHTTSSNATTDKNQFKTIANRLKKYIIDDNNFIITKTWYKSMGAQSAAQDLDCYFLDRKGFAKKYGKAIILDSGDTKWRKYLAISYDQNHPTVRGAYLHAVSTFAIIAGVSQLPKKVNSKKFVKLYYKDGLNVATAKKVSSAQSHNNFGPANTLPKQATINMQYLVRKYYNDYIKKY